MTREFFCFGAGFVDDFTTVGAQGVGIISVALQTLFELLLLFAYLGTFVFPITFVAGNVEEIFVKVDVVAAHYLLGRVDNLTRESDFTGYLYGKRTAGAADGEPE